MSSAWAWDRISWLALTDRRPGFYAEGVEDVTKLPLVTQALIGRGYSDEDVRKILGENVLRVFRRVIG